MTKSWIGTDFSEQMIIEAKKRGGGDNLSFEVADAGGLSFANEKFNCALIANALHIMPKPDRAMREIYRVLKPKGILLAPTFLWKEGKERNILKKIMSILDLRCMENGIKNHLKNLLKKTDFQCLK